MTKKSLFKISFANQDEIYEIYARSIKESDMFGFLEVEELVLESKRHWWLIRLKKNLKWNFVMLSAFLSLYIPYFALMKFQNKGRQKSKIT